LGVDPSLSEGASAELHSILPPPSLRPPTAVKTVSQTRRSPPSLLGAAMLSLRAWNAVAITLRITARELEIIQGVFDNLTEAGIARRLQVTEHTVHTHLNRLFKKLHVTTRTELVLRVMQEMLALTVSAESPLPPICPRFAAGTCCLHSPCLKK